MPLKDTKGHVIETREILHGYGFGASSKSMTTVEYAYTSGGEMSARTFFTDRNNIGYEEMGYSRDGYGHLKTSMDIIKGDDGSGGEYSRDTMRIYNEKGELESLTDNNGKVFLYSYEQDRRGKNPLRDMHCQPFSSRSRIVYVDPEHRACFHRDLLSVGPVHCFRRFHERCESPPAGNRKAVAEDTVGIRQGNLGNLGGIRGLETAVLVVVFDLNRHIPLGIAFMIPLPVFCKP